MTKVKTIIVLHFKYDPNQRITIGYLLKCDLYFVQIMYLEENLYSVRPAPSSVYHFLILPTFVPPPIKMGKIQYRDSNQIATKQRKSQQISKNATIRYNATINCTHYRFSSQFSCGECLHTAELSPNDIYQVYFALEAIFFFFQLQLF